jgi:hypothetical protein
VNNIPLLVAQVAVKLSEHLARVVAVDRRAMNIGLAFEQFTDRERVPHRNRVADEEHARQAGRVFDLHKRGVKFLRFCCRLGDVGG